MAIKYDNYVKRPRAEIEYTPKQIQELQKCSKSVEYFLKYVKIIHPDKGEIQFKPYKYQKKLLKKFKKNRYNIVLASRQSGKCISFDNNIKIREKQTGKIKEITIGNFFNMIKKNKT